MGEILLEGTKILKALAANISDLKSLPANVMSQAGSIVEANFSFNSIEGDSLDALQPFRHLQTLVLDNNSLTSLATLPPLPELTTLWLNNNNLEQLEDVIGILSRQCPKLQYLSLLRNPCCPNELTGKGENEYRMYRLRVLYRIPTL